MEIDTYFGQEFYCRKCKRWTWHDRVRRICGKDVWGGMLFSCVNCRTIVNWCGEEWVKRRLNV
jgi:hypothetical protein